MDISNLRIIKNDLYKKTVISKATRKKADKKENIKGCLKLADYTVF